MSDIFITSDQHFFHAGIIKHCYRPFETVEEMNEIMLERWNERISNKDVVYFLGDLAWKKLSNAPEILKLVERLNGQKHWLKGNHDTKEIVKLVGHKFESIREIKEIKIDLQPITLCHYAMLSWNKSHYGAWQLFGHSHGQLGHIHETQQKLLRPTQMDVGVDTNNFYPYSFEEIRTKILTQQEAENDLRNSITPAN